MYDPLSNAYKLCSNCGGRVEADSRFCKYCAFNLSNSSGAQPVAAGGQRVIYLVLAILLAAVVVIIVLIILKNNSTQSSTTNVTSSTIPNTSIIQPTPTPAPTPSGFELTRDTVLSIVKGRMTKNVVAAMATIAIVPDAQTWKVYDRMVSEKVIICPSRSMFGDYANCRPGPGGRELKLSGNGTLQLSIGSKVPSVNGISRLDQTSALAQVTLTFEPASNYEFFKKYQGAFKSNPLFGSGYDIDTEQHTVHLRLYDDGWRIEKIE